MMVAGTMPDFIEIEVITRKSEEENSISTLRKVLLKLEEMNDIKRLQGEGGGGSQVSPNESSLPGRDDENSLLVNFPEAVHEEAVKKLLLHVAAPAHTVARKVGRDGVAAMWQVIINLPANEARGWVGGDRPLEVLIYPSPTSVAEADALELEEAAKVTGPAVAMAAGGSVRTMEMVIAKERPKVGARTWRHAHTTRAHTRNHVHATHMHMWSHAHTERVHMWSQAHAMHMRTWKHA